MSKLIPTLMIAVGLLRSASAFCGFYVAKADTSLFNNASKVVIVRDGIRRMYAEQEDVFYYLTVTNQNFPMPGPPGGPVEDVEAGVLAGMYCVDREDDGGAEDSKRGARDGDLVFTPGPPPSGSAR